MGIERQPTGKVCHRMFFLTTKKERMEAEKKLKCHKHHAQCTKPVDCTGYRTMNLISLNLPSILLGLHIAVDKVYQIDISQPFALPNFQHNFRLLWLCHCFTSSTRNEFVIIFLDSIILDVFSVQKISLCSEPMSFKAVQT